MVVLGLAALAAPVGAWAGGEAERAAADRAEFTAVDSAELPSGLAAALARSEVFVVGEVHYVQESADFWARHLAELHALGYRRIAVESLHCYGPLFDAYVTGRRFGLSADQAGLVRTLAEGVKALNDRLRAEGRDNQQLHLDAFDMNHWPGEAAKTAAELAGVDEALRARVLEVEAWSSRIRADWNDTAREAVIRSNLAEIRGRLAPGERLLIITGSWHAQRTSVWNTTDDPAFEWLGSWLPRTLGADRVYNLAEAYYQGTFKETFQSKDRRSYRAEGTTLTAELARRRPADQAFVDLTALDSAGPTLAFDSAGESRSTELPGRQFSGYLFYPRATVLRSSLGYER